MKNKENLAKLKIASAMLIFGTVGIFREMTPLPSDLIALCRGLIGALFLLILKGGKLNFKAIKQNLLPLIISSIALGLNWVFLFEAYNYTTVAAATLYYYMAPMIIIIASPFILKESFKLRDLLFVLTSLLGIALVSGVFEGGNSAFSIKGLCFGISAAFLYATVVITNKKLKDISALDRTISQLIISAAVLLPYFLIGNDLSDITLEPKSIFLLAIMGIVHTGIAYALYFGALPKIPTKTAAIFSYIDPVFAIILSSALALNMPSIYVIFGAVLILGSSFISELLKNK